MKDFEFTQDDPIGQETLEVIANADKFNEWMFTTISQHCEGKILEIGSGIGNISHLFLDAGYQIKLSDIRDSYCQHLNDTFKDKLGFLGTTTMNLTDKDFDAKFKHEFNSYDTVFALNVVEHIENDILALSNCRKLLKIGGRLIILVPAYNFLYNQFDEELGHYRRYTKKSLRDVFIKSNFKIIKSQYFNSAGILGWYVSGKLMKNKSIPRDQMKLYNRLVPIFKIIDKSLFNSFGLSTITIGIKE